MCFTAFILGVYHNGGRMMVVGIHDESARKVSQWLNIAIGMIHDFSRTRLTLNWLGNWLGFKDSQNWSFCCHGHSDRYFGHFIAMDVAIIPLVTMIIQTLKQADSERSHQMLSNVYFWFWLVRPGSIVWFGLQFGNCCFSGRKDVLMISMAPIMSCKSSDVFPKGYLESYHVVLGDFRYSMSFEGYRQKRKSRFCFLTLVYFYIHKWKHQKSLDAEKNPI